MAPEAWCEACGEPVGADQCPTCGQVLVAAEAEVGPEAPPVPWHFKLLVVATVLYLGWRAVQGVAWLIGRF